MQVATPSSSSDPLRTLATYHGAVAGQLKVPYVIPAFGTVIKNWNTYTYRIGTDGPTIDLIWFKGVGGQVRIKTIAQIHDQTQPSQSAEAASWEKYRQLSRYSDAVYEAMSAGDVDFGRSCPRSRV